MVQGEDSELIPPKAEWYGRKGNLLSKYDIPVSYLDFDYVEKCTNGRELEKIYHILKSGEEGHYPELMKVTEEKLKQYKPKSKYLRKFTRIINKEELSLEERNEITKDLSDWVTNISKDNKELECRKTNIASTEDTPEVRTELLTKTYVEPKAEKCKNEKRIKSTDYASWDKYDPDTEILKMDLEEEKLKKTIIQEVKKPKPKKTVTFNAFATEAEASYEANREREKGNEYFKAQEYKLAIEHYTVSLSCKPTIEAWNNRALAYIKQRKYQEALEDCDKALAIDPYNFKANYRRSLALEKLDLEEDLLESVDRCLQINPNDPTVQEIAERVRKKLGADKLPNKRYVIEDVEEPQRKGEENNPEKTPAETEENEKPNNVEINPSDQKKFDTTSSKNGVKGTKIFHQRQDKKQNQAISEISSERKQKNSEQKTTELIPIPGTSTMRPPYYVTCANNPQAIQQAMNQVNNRIQLLGIIPNDATEDECLVNHFQKESNRTTSEEPLGKKIICKSESSLNHHLTDRREVHKKNSTENQPESNKLDTKIIESKKIENGGISNRNKEIKKNGYRLSTVNKKVEERGDTVHIERGDTVHIEGGDTVHIEGGDTVHIEIGDTVHIERGDTVHIERGDTVHIEGGDTVHIEGGDTVHIERGDAVHIERGDTVHIERGDTVHTERGTVHSTSRDRENQQRKEIFDNTHSSSKLRKPAKDSEAGGEPHVTQNDAFSVPDDIHSPYTFMKTWASVADDYTLKKHAEIIRKLDMSRIGEVIGCQLDNNIFHQILKCLSQYFTVADEVEKVYNSLVHITRLPRFGIISMLMSAEDQHFVFFLMDFLQQHDKIVPDEVKQYFL